MTSQSTASVINAIRTEASRRRADSEPVVVDEFFDLLARLVARRHIRRCYGVEKHDTETTGSQTHKSGDGGYVVVNAPD
ncbi:MAG: hypothetical protein KDA42_13180 [Planctomycetales bacterium]|nr:hypothetical protein [Planctomycetales bacterium]